MGVNDDIFWDQILGYIEDQRLVPVVGPELNVVRNGNVEQTFTSLIGQRLAGKYDLSTASEMRTMQEAVAAILQKHGRDEVELLYGPINRIIKEADPEPCDALRDLAAIDDLRLFVSTTPDRLLAKALNEARFRGRDLTRELAFSPSRSTSGQAQNCAGGCADRYRRSEFVWSGRLDSRVRNPRGGPAGMAARIASRCGAPAGVAGL